MSRSDKPNWASKIIHQLNTNQRDLIAIQRSLVRIEASLMKTESTNHFVDRNTPRSSSIGPAINRPRPNGNNVPTTANSGRQLSNQVPPTPSRGRQLLNQLADQPIPKRPCLQHRNFGYAADVRQCNTNCNFLELNPRPMAASAPVNNPPAAMSIEQQNEMEENLLNLSDTD